MYNPIFRVIMSCYAIVEVCGARGTLNFTTSPKTGPSHVASVFNGKIPPSLYDKLLTGPSKVRFLRLRSGLECDHGMNANFILCSVSVGATSVTCSRTTVLPICCESCL